MSAKVKLSDVLDVLESVGNELRAYFDRERGRVIPIVEDDVPYVDEGEPLDGYPKWMQEEIKLVRAINDDDGTRFVPLPDRFDINEYRMMKVFCYSVSDEAARNGLLRAIHGKGAFRRFKHRIRSLGIERDWLAYRDQQYRDLAIEWCKDNDIEYIED